MESVRVSSPLVTALDRKIILASKSPRRKELLRLLGFEFTVSVKAVDESFPPDMDPVSAARFIATKKANAFIGKVNDDELVITADTIVTVDRQSLGKPSDSAEAAKMLRLLSGRKHQVITAVALLESGRDAFVFHEITDVYFKELTPGEIAYYIDHYKPYDKAGAYGIQEWIGAVAIEKISGSYTNVVGLPTTALCTALQELAGR